MLNAYTSSPFAPLDPFPRMLLVELHGSSSMLACRTECRTLRTKALECWVATRSIGFDREVASDATGRLGPSRTPCTHGAGDLCTARPFSGCGGGCALAHAQLLAVGVAGGQGVMAELAVDLHRCDWRPSGVGVTERESGEG